MTDPLVFPSTTPRHGLPMLFAGQSQKEVSVNGAHVLADMLLHPAIEGEAAAPPAAPTDGECWLVGAPATGAFAGQEEALASFQAGSWLFARPRDGMRIFERTTGRFVLYADGWRRAAAPPEPTGGTTVDQEARDTIATLIAALRSQGLFAAE